MQRAKNKEDKDYKDYINFDINMLFETRTYTLQKLSGFRPLYTRYAYPTMPAGVAGGGGG